MLWVKLFIKHKFDEQTAREFLIFFHQLAAAFKLNRFDVKEPVRRPIDWDDLREPAQLLAGSPECDAGAILLKGARYRFLAVIAWNQDGVVPWDFYLSCKFFRTKDSVEKFIQFVVAISKRFPVIYGWAAPQDDWKAKHWLIEGTSESKLGTTLEEGLPGMYWITIFGPQLVEHFGRARLEGLPVSRIIDLGAAGLLVQVREMPSEPELAERLREDRKIAEALGGEYFFDITRPRAVTSPIPGVTELSAQAAPASEARDLDPADAFEFEGVRAPDGQPFSGPEALAEMLVVYLHREIDGLHEYSRASLQVLDDYLRNHPPAGQYTTDHLMKEFIPALGAYLGQVLVKQLSAAWEVGSPLMRSIVRTGDKRLHPFRHAYRTVYQGQSLAQFYDSAAPGA
jgi:hypothetical protein